MADDRDARRRAIAESARPFGEAEARLRQEIAEGAQSPPDRPADEAYFSGLRNHAEARARVQAVIDRYRVRLLPGMFQAWLNGLDDRRVALLAENWEEVMLAAARELDRLAFPELRDPDLTDESDTEPDYRID